VTGLGPCQTNSVGLAGGRAARRHGVCGGGDGSPSHLRNQPGAGEPLVGAGRTSLRIKVQLPSGGSMIADWENASSRP
jgi:hypothetical protein